MVNKINDSCYSVGTDLLVLRTGRMLPPRLLYAYGVIITVNPETKRVNVVKNRYGCDGPNINLDDELWRLTTIKGMDVSVHLNHVVSLLLTDGLCIKKYIKKHSLC